MKINMTKFQLERWLRLKEYSIPAIKMTKAERNDTEYEKMENNNRILGRSFHHSFEKWYKKYKRIPTPQEFVAMQMQDIRKNYANEGWKRKYKINFQWTPIVEKGIKQRLLRSYKSFINELHTELMIKELYPTYGVIRNDELDYSGIDLLVRDRKNNIDHKIHITKNSDYAIGFLFRKEGKELKFRGYGSKLFARPTWKRINNSLCSQRDFTGHTFLLYTDAPNDAVKVINGYPLFRESHIKMKIDVLTELRTA